MSELGKRLKEAREERNYSLEDLQRITKIQKRYLTGIEEGNYQVMPGQFYVRAFIKQYAEAVGLHPDELFEEYKAEIPNTYKDKLPEQLSRVRTKRTFSTRGSKIVDMIPRLLVVFFIIGGLITVWFFLQNRDMAEKPNPKIENDQTEYEESKAAPPKPAEEKKEDKKEEETAETKEEEVVEEKPVQELVQTAKAGKSATYELKNINSFVLEVTAKPGAEAWIDIQNAKGHKFFYGMMKDTQKQEFDLSKESHVVLNLGSTTNTEIKINGEVFEYPFNPSEKIVQNITILFTPAAE